MKLVGEDNFTGGQVHGKEVVVKVGHAEEPPAVRTCGDVDNPHMRHGNAQVLRCFAVRVVDENVTAFVLVDLMVAAPITDVLPRAAGDATVRQRGKRMVDFLQARFTVALQQLIRRDDLLPQITRGALVSVVLKEQMILEPGEPAVNPTVHAGRQRDHFVRARRINKESFDIHALLLQGGLDVTKQLKQCLRSRRMTEDE